ncbi:DNA-binding protein, 42 kDa [Cryptococcus amylolentus CBS 6039]|uniref:DNA-binding protein, 42 kDa n=1 Tax=Cryptococcus amylolentus CBS 6039 TaxID=1295533 RepID=A0A1E3HVT5_9TREE|nr:DNA-binding protein, 42 kDa [Cryptococcus amylolentus CBS 6039]ODN80428.1 DNA-binding protein, 42 kDa [Cryptococcus amylolentus CBS 6039]
MSAPQVDLKKPEVPKEEAAQQEKGLSNDALTKYTTAGQALTDVIKKFIPLVAPGKKVLDLCIEGDKLVADTVAPLWNKPKNGVKVVKGSAFPTSISVNNTVSHVSPLPSDPEIVLKDGDVVKIMLGVHLDGYPVTHAETIHLSSKTDGLAADAIKAAYEAAQAAMRTVKVGGKNWDVTEVVEKVAKSYDCVGVEGMLSCQHEKDVTDGKKRVLLNPSPELRRDHETVTFEEGEVYGIDVLVVTGTNGKSKAESARTSIYKRSDINYQLKMKTSRTVFSEITKKAGPFPFSLRALDDEKRARMAVQEAVTHGLLKPYDITQTAAGTIVAEFFFTIALLPAGPILLSPTPVWYSADKVSSSKSIEDQELKDLIARPLRAPKKKKKAAAAAAETKA